MLHLQCPHCNAEVQVPEGRAGGTTACLSCGNEMTVPVPVAQAAPPPSGEPAPAGPGQPASDVPLSGMAVTSLVFSVIGLLTSCILIGGVFGIVGLILGAIAMARTGGATPQLRGRGLAATGLGLGVTAVALVPVFMFFLGIMLPALGRAREIANQRVCATNLKQIGTALYTYSSQL